jgi:hypothetical protein
MAKPKIAPPVVYAVAVSRPLRFSSIVSGRPKRKLAPSTSGSVTTVGRIANQKDGNKRPPPSSPSGRELIASAAVKTDGAAAAARVPNRTDFVNAHIEKVEQSQP